jgi:hypothetical protein
MLSPLPTFASEIGGDPINSLLMLAPVLALISARPVQTIATNNMAIPKEKNLAVQLVTTLAFCVAPFGLFHAIWYGVMGEYASSWAAGLVSILAGAIFFWWYGLMQRKQQD